MYYYYFNPFSKQYFFPEGYKKYIFLSSFYQPYNFKGKLLWCLWQKTPFLKYFFTIKETKIPLPINNIRKYAGNDTVLAFNSGTKGEEQKISVLGCQPNQTGKIFMKYAQSQTAMNLTKNEILILKETKNFDVTPQIINYEINSDFVVLMTSFVDGKKYKETQMNEKLLELLIRFSKIEIKNIKEYGEENVKKVFSHGDFCPWNLLIKDENIMAIDWEMAGNYPLGYDLFTFIFQTSFLLSPKKSVEEILQQNYNYINNYFSNYSIKNWMEYLKSFAQIKTNIENQKDHSTLIKRYKELIEICDEN